MSTKNLARTIIEGGRERASARSRRYANATLRMRERETIARLEPGTERDDPNIPRSRGFFRRNFYDKLGPPLRWLSSHVGRPWALVHSELFKKFDTRTTAGRHIVFDHMLGWVDDGHRCRGWFRFAVDEHGILRRVAQERYRYRRCPEPLPRAEGELERWLDGRRIGERGEILFWFEPTETCAYRQGRRLGEDDAALCRSLPGWFRERHHPAAPPPDPRARS